MTRSEHSKTTTPRPQTRSRTRPQICIVEGLRLVRSVTVTPFRTSAEASRQTIFLLSFIAAETSSMEAKIDHHPLHICGTTQTHSPLPTCNQGYLPKLPPQ